MLSIVRLSVTHYAGVEENHYWTIQIKCKDTLPEDAFKCIYYIHLVVFLLLHYSYFIMNVYLSVPFQCCMEMDWISELYSPQNKLSTLNWMLQLCWGETINN